MIILSKKNLLEKEILEESNLPEKCLKCGTPFIQEEKHVGWTWFTCSVCGTDYRRMDNKWMINK